MHLAELVCGRCALVYAQTENTQNHFVSSNIAF